MKSILALFLLIGSLAAQPQGFNLAGGDASPPIMDVQGNMVIQSGTTAIVNWDSFSIAAAEQIHFQQQGSSSAILNRVTGSQGSDLLGLLSSNGRVFLINPNGVFIGQTGRIETADFLASTFDVLNADFLQEKDLLFCGKSDKSIQNLGTISCPAGNIHLFAAQVVNEGTLQALSGKVLLAAGGDILLQKDGSSHIYIRPELTQEKIAKEIDGAAIENIGSIEAMVVSLQAGDSPYAKAIRCSGHIDATTVQEIGGEIYLVAEKGITEIDSGSLSAKGGIVHVLGEKVALQNKTRIDVSAPSGGGTVLIGGDFQGNNPEIQNAFRTYVSKESVIKADALENGDGGKVIIWGDEGTFAYGLISARGGLLAGDGGFTEVSGSFLDFQGLSDTTAPNGRIGTLLLDPQTITIGAANTNYTGLFTADGPICAGSTTNTLDGQFTALSTASTIFAATTLVPQLNLSCVTINTSATGNGAGLGSITVSSPIGAGGSWTAATTLTLIADANIVISQPITNSNVAAPEFTAMNFTASGGVGSTSAGIAVSAALSCSGAGDIILAGTGGMGASNQNGIATTASISTAQGSITLSGTGVGNGTGGVNNGVFLTSSCTAPNGTITFSNCIGGQGATIGDNQGVRINAVTVNALNIVATNNIQGGQSNGFGTSSSGFISNGATIGSASTNSIAIAASTASSVGEGIAFNIASLIQVGGSGTIAIIGTRTTGGSGIELSGTSQITAVNGNISITGISSGSNITLNVTPSVTTSGSGNIMINGSVLLIGGSPTITAGGTGSVSFSSTIDGAFPLTVNAGGSITFSGSIGSATPLVSLTAQPGSGFSTSPTFGTIPNGTVSFGGPTVTTSGAISISATGRTQPMSIATIIGTGNLTFTSSSFTMGANESMTVLGNLIIDGALSLSDIVAAGNLTLTGSSITLNPQAPASYLASTGKFYTSPNAHIISLNAPTVSPAVTPAGSRVLASGFPTETAFAKVLKFGGTVLNYDFQSNKLPPLAQAAVNQFGVANSQVVANGPWGLLPILDLRFFPIYAICNEEPCSTGIFVPFIFESDIIDGNIFRSL